MSLTISEEAKQRLAPFLTEANTFLLVANDGSNPYSSAEGCCMIGDRFIIVPVDQAEAPYTETIANDSFHVYTSTYDQMFLTGHLQLVIHPNAGTITLKNESGILDSNVDIYQHYKSKQNA